MPPWWRLERICRRRVVRVRVVEEWEGRRSVVPSWGGAWSGRPAKRVAINGFVYEHVTRINQNLVILLREQLPNRRRTRPATVPTRKSI